MLKVGPIEIRLLLIAINVTLMSFGRRAMLAIVPYGLVTAAIILVVEVYRTQRRLKQMDLVDCGMLRHCTDRRTHGR